jgi:hypothetical protein
MMMSGDLISRQAVLDKAVYTETEEGWSGMTVDVKDIELLPSATPQESKTGHWIDHQEGRWIYAKCSECETVHDTRTNYCPNCGCKMYEHKGVLEQLAEKQNSLLATTKAWSGMIDKNGNIY